MVRAVSWAAAVLMAAAVANGADPKPKPAGDPNVIAGVHLKPDAPQNVRDYVTRAAKERPAAIAEAKKQLAAARAAPIGNGKQYPTYADKKQAIEDAQAEVKRRQAADYVPVSETPGDTVGAIGSMPNPTIKIKQVVDDGNAIAVTYTAAGHVRAQIAGAAPVRQDDVNYVEHARWLQTPTAGMVDGETADVAGLWECVGTKTYETAIGGSNTVRGVQANCAQGLRGQRCGGQRRLNTANGRAGSG